MCFAQFVGLQVLEGLTRPCEEYLARNDIYELDLVNFFDSTLTPMNQQNFSSQIEIFALTVFRCDGDMLDNQGCGRNFWKNHSKINFSTTVKYFTAWQMVLKIACN